jgi:hypothetical protein
VDPTGSSFQRSRASPKTGREGDPKELNRPDRVGRSKTRIAGANEGLWRSLAQTARRPIAVQAEGAAPVREDRGSGQQDEGSVDVRSAVENCAAHGQIIERTRPGPGRE